MIDLTKPTNNLLDDLIEDSIHILSSVAERTLVVGYSGGKDSTTVACLVLEAIKRGILKKENVIFMYSDTQMEMPNIHQNALKFLDYIKDKFDIRTEIVTRPLKNSFWVNILGKGKKPPSNFWRWCVEPLKIRPMKKQLKNIGDDYIMAIGIRTAESTTRGLKYADSADEQDEKVNFTCDTQGECFAPMDDEDRVLPILRWKNCNIWDFIQFHPLTYDYPIKDLREIYLFNDAVRYGCWSCTVAGQKTHISKQVLDLFPQYRGLYNIRLKLIELSDIEKSRHQYYYVRRQDIRSEESYHKYNKSRGWDIKWNGMEWKYYRLTIKARNELLDMLIKEGENLGYPLISQEEITEIKIMQKIWVDGYVSTQKKVVDDWKYHDTVPTTLDDYF